MINWKKILWYTVCVLLIAIPVALIVAITYYLGWMACVYLAIGWTLRSVVLYYSKNGSRKGKPLY